MAVEEGVEQVVAPPQKAKEPSEDEKRYFLFFQLFWFFCVEIISEMLYLNFIDFV